MRKSKPAIRLLVRPGCFENVADRKEARETWGILRIPAAIVHHVWKIEDFGSAGRGDI